MQKLDLPQSHRISGGSNFFRRFQRGKIAEALFFVPFASGKVLLFFNHPRNLLLGEAIAFNHC